MSGIDVNLLDIRGLVIAPAGCGKTQLIADAVERHVLSKPILILTHTNAGVAALRTRLNRAQVPTSRYRLMTLDGWSLRLSMMFPKGAGYSTEVPVEPDYLDIREAALRLLDAGHIGDVLGASYDRLFVDEYQDCTIRQHGIIYCAAQYLPTCVLGDPAQAIFGFNRVDPLADWDTDVQVRSLFPGN